MGDESNLSVVVHGNDVEVYGVYVHKTALINSIKPRYFDMQLFPTFFSLASAFLIIAPASAATLKADIACTACTSLF